MAFAEELIWSKEEAILENKVFYIQAMGEKDKCEFLKLMREHRLFGELLKSLDSFGSKKADNDIWETYTTEGKSFAIYEKDIHAMIGYFYIEALETSAPQITIQFKKKIEFNEYILEMAKMFFNMLNKEYRLRAVHVYVNSDFEREIFTALGYENIKDEVMLALPV